MKLEFISTKEAENIRRQMPKSKTMEEYESYWKKLPQGQVGKIEVGTKDGIKPQTVKNRIKRAGIFLGLDSQIKRVGNTILFWIE